MEGADGLAGLLRRRHRHHRRLDGAGAPRGAAIRDLARCCRRSELRRGRWAFWGVVQRRKHLRPVDFHRQPTTGRLSDFGRFDAEEPRDGGACEVDIEDPDRVTGEGEGKRQLRGDG